MVLKNIKPNERSQNKKLHVVWFYLGEISRKGNFIERKQISGCPGREWDWLQMAMRGLFRVMEKFWKCILTIFAQLCKLTKSYWIVYLKQVSFVLCKLYMNKADFLKWPQKKRDCVPEIPLNFVLLVNLEWNMWNWALPDRSQTEFHCDILTCIQYPFTTSISLTKPVFDSGFQSRKTYFQINNY